MLSFARFAIAVTQTVLIVGCLVAVPSKLRGQSSAPLTAEPYTIVGIVTDTLGAPLADVSVFVSPLRKRTQTRADGTFRFDSIAMGTFEVRVRSIGLVASVQRVVVGRNGGSVAIRVSRFRAFLPTMLTVESRGGLSGVVGDTAYRAMANVRVTVGGAGPSVHTDSTGAFFVPLNPGDYMVRLKIPGFARQLIGVSIPKTGGQRMAAWMVP